MAIFYAKENGKLRPFVKYPNGRTEQLPDIFASRPMQEKSLGQTAFEAYDRYRGGMNHQGDKTPAWDDLPLPIREAWDVAAKATVARTLNKRTVQ